MLLLKRKPSDAEAEALPEAPELPPEPAAEPCASCGAPLEPDQLACLECGHVVHRRRLIPSGWPLRAGLASGVALLVSACAGLGVSAAFQGGGKVPKTVAVAPPPTIPAPTTAAPPASAPVAPASPAPAAPAAHAAAPPAAKPTTPPVGTPSPHAGGATPSTGSASPGANSGSGGAATSPAQPAGGNPGPFPQGVPFASAYLLNANDTADNPNETQNTIDGDTSTSWSTTHNPSLPLGIWFDAGSSGSYPRFGLLASGSAYTVRIYGSDANNPPQGSPPGSGWTLLTSGDVTVGPGKNRIPLNSGVQARYYLVWITGVTGSGRATIVDAALLG